MTSSTIKISLISFIKIRFEGYYSNHMNLIYEKININNSIKLYNDMNFEHFELLPGLLFQFLLFSDVKTA